MENNTEIAGRIKATGAVSKFYKCTEVYTDTLTGLQYSSEELEFLEPRVTKEFSGRIKSSGVVSKFSKVTAPGISEKYDYMDTVSGVFYKENEIEFQELKEKKEFYGQVCQDPETTKKFRDLHKELVDRVIEWCNENSVYIDEFHLHADGIRESIPYASWQPCTDSGFEMYSRESLDKEDPEPYLFSM